MQNIGSLLLIINVFLTLMLQQVNVELSYFLKYTDGEFLDDYK